MAAEGPQQKLSREQGEKNFDDPIPVGTNGCPLTQIACAAAELVPTIQYGNVTVGPIVVKRYVEELGDDHLKEQIRIIQSICEEAVAEDRKSVQGLIRQSAQGRIQS